ncbi:MAG: methyltransferase domain-containing protein [Chloroflexaceae bacterium]|nr:methyltransferase domain-containing protein [Chloroflexaceae bacterium]
MTIGVSPLAGLEHAARTVPFDQFGRYHMLREAVEACRTRLGIRRFSLLDVGGLFQSRRGPMLPATLFFPHDTLTVLDVVESDLPGYIKGDGTALHFEDASFDLVVSADTLEHVPQPDRARFWHELLRVAQHGVLLLAPFRTPAVEIAETILFEYIKQELRTEQQQLKEHTRYVLPVLDEWLTFLEAQQVPARAYPTGYLHAWLGMMLLKHMALRLCPESEPLLDWYYNQCFFPTERRNPAYRHLIVAEKTAGVGEAIDAALAPTVLPDSDSGPNRNWDQQGDCTDWQSTLLPMLLALTQRQTIAEHWTTTHDTMLHHQHQHLVALEHIIDNQHHLMNTMNTMNDQVRGLQEQNRNLTERAHRLEDQNRDLTERTRWLEDQNQALRHHLEAVQNGRVMRMLNAFLPKR